MDTINWLAILVAGISSFVLGGVWYSPALFGNAWMKENNFSVDDVKKSNKAKIFGWSFLFSLIMAANLGMFLSDPAKGCETCAPTVDLVWGLTAGGLAGLWVFCALATVALFEIRSWRYIFINGGYCLVALALMGAIIGAWR
ncbi:MAG TPA: DUF1761 domain-containing protein [Chitinophagaceae bacterium]|nr:DUF1761 domain-containing protein [Chitinophagaceae bacterium]